MATKTRSSSNGSVWVDYHYTTHFAYYATRFDRHTHTTLIHFFQGYNPTGRNVPTL